MPLSRDRDTTMRARDLLVVPVIANTMIYAGALVCASAAGLAQPGAVAATLTALGRAEEPCDNLGGAAGAKSVTVRRGVFLFKNLGADPVVQADMGKDCFVVDDETVAKTHAGNTRSRAGKVLGIEAAGVWVEIS